MSGDFVNADFYIRNEIGGVGFEFCEVGVVEVRFKSFAGCPFFDEDELGLVFGFGKEIVGDAGFFGSRGGEHIDGKSEVFGNGFGFDFDVGDENDHRFVDFGRVKIVEIGSFLM